MSVLSFHLPAPLEWPDHRVLSSQSIALVKGAAEGVHSEIFHSIPAASSAFCR